MYQQPPPSEPLRAPSDSAESNLAVPYRPIQYLGNKLRALEEIIATAGTILKPNSRVCDLFTGTSVVAQAFSNAGHRVTAVDVQKYSTVFAGAMLGVARTAEDLCPPDLVLSFQLPKQKDSQFAGWRSWARKEQKALKTKKYQLLNNIYGDLPLIWRSGRNSNYARISQNNTSCVIDELPLISSIYAGSYFGVEQSIAIDKLRYAIHALYRAKAITAWQFDGYLTALLSAASAAAHSAGKHFAQPLNAGSMSNVEFLQRRLFEDRQVDIISAFERACGAITNSASRNVGHVAVCSSAERYLESCKPQFDLIYLDPPYTAQQYSRFYHVLETLVSYSCPQLLHDGKVTRGLYPVARYKSAFSSKRQAPGAFRDILSYSKRSGASVLISYSESAHGSDGNSRMISLRSLLDECKRAFGNMVECEALSHRYRQFNSSAAANEHRNDREILIQCRNT